MYVCMYVYTNVHTLTLKCTYEHFLAHLDEIKDAQGVNILPKHLHA